MNQQVNLITNYSKEIQEWEQELAGTGVIKNESQLITAISHVSNPITLSKLLTLAAQSRLGQYNQDRLAPGWFEKALKLDPENQTAKEFIIWSDWKKMNNMLSPLTFPPMR
ncbi:MAG: hypothetical protein ACJ8MO_32770 [Bacillus sp. (in: firmicutes)]